MCVKKKWGFKSGNDEFPPLVGSAMFSLVFFLCDFVPYEQDLSCMTLSSPTCFL